MATRPPRQGTRSRPSEAPSRTSWPCAPTTTITALHPLRDGCRGAFRWGCARPALSQTTTCFQAYRTLSSRTIWRTCGARSRRRPLSAASWSSWTAWARHSPRCRPPGTTLATCTTCGCLRLRATWRCRKARRRSERRLATARLRARTYSRAPPSHASSSAGYRSARLRNSTIMGLRISSPSARSTQGFRHTSLATGMHAAR